MTPAACLEIAHERLRETEQAASKFEILQNNRNISDYIEDTIDEHKANDSFNTAIVLVGAIESLMVVLPYPRKWPSGYPGY